MKSLAIALSASLGTAILFGVATAGSQSSQPVASPSKKTLHLKLEWVQEKPRVSESVLVTVDNGQVATLTRPAALSRGLRVISITPTLSGDHQVTLDLDIISNNSRVERLKTRLTAQLDETKVVSAITTREGAKGASKEEILFVTPGL